ncbi:putative mitochondrial protein ymf40 [Dendrobium catenatum]|uniref:Putative mitochondrial protein ymf40 n=1 Tax=Dendrobium catenatum TaxID=906689 RepID=A0A2I0VEE5_9ASPA|nr:putative mitochondrial protein ymf40 [Dendrobium catenatum]
MKEAIRMVPESIYDPEFPDTSHFRSGRGCHSALRRIKEEWGTSRWFLEFDIRKCFHTIDRHRFISILKEEIDDPKFFYSTQKMFSAGRLVGGEKGPDSVSHSVLLSALPGNIYLHKLDQEIGRIRQKHEITLVLRIRSVLLRTGRRIDYQENSGEEASFNAPQDNRAIMVGRFKSIQRKATFHSLVSSWHTPPTSTPRRRGDQKTPFVFPPSAALAAFLNKPSSLLCAAFLIEAAGLTPKAEFYGREGFHKNLAMRYLIKYCKRRGLLIELGGEAILVIRSERRLAHLLRAICRRLTTWNRGCLRASHRNTKTYHPLPTIRPEPLGRLRRINNHSCTEYGRIPRYGHSGSPSEDNSHTILARAGEASTGKAPYPYNCLPPTLRHPFQV